jgi:hypothetical protein
MFTAEQIKILLNSENDSLTATPDTRYGLYKFDRGDKIEIRLTEKFHREEDGRNRKSIGYMDTIMRCYIPKEIDVFDAIYRSLRNCLLIERVGNGKN